MSLTRSVAHNTALQLAGQVSSVVLGLVALAVMTRSLGTEQFGWYVTATGFLQFIGIIIDFGFTVTTSNLLAEGRFHKQSLINTLFSWRLVSALFFLGLAPFIILLFPYPTAVKSAVAVISISFLFLSLNQIFIGYYRSRLKILTVVISELLGRIV
jgi:O-antigen/teichoic acid export membrane protein